MNKFIIYVWNKQLGTPHEEFSVFANSAEEAIEKLGLSSHCEAYVMP